MAGEKLSGPTQPAAFDFLKTIMPGVAPELQPLLTLGYDIDSFEKDAPLFAKQMGVPVDELVELAAEARTGSDPTSDKRPRQHVVSRSLLTGFSTGTSPEQGIRKSGRIRSRTVGRRRSIPPALASSPTS